MEKNKINKSFILIFLTLLTLPLILLICRVKLEDPFSSKKISANFSRNFPLKHDYFKLFSFLKEDVFNSLSSPKKVIKWDNGWYFLGDNYSNNLSESKGLILFTKEELEILSENLKYKKEWSQKNNMLYIMSIAPNKESVYGDMLPIAQSGTNKKMFQIDSICKTLDIPFVDLGKQIPLKSKVNTYHKSDTHWNEYGSYFGYKEFIEKLKGFYPSKEIAAPYTINDFKIDSSYNKDFGDLKQMIGELRGENMVTLQLLKPSNAKDEKAKNEIPSTIVVDPSEYEMRFSAEVNNDIKILFLRDSFGGSILKYLKEHFKETIFIFHRDFDKNLLKNEKPTILVEEIVEREVDVLLLDQFLNKESN